jgi:hypothetical protein
MSPCTVIHCYQLLYISFFPKIDPRYETSSIDYLQVWHHHAAAVYFPGVKTIRVKRRTQRNSNVATILLILNFINRTPSAFRSYACCHTISLWTQEAVDWANKLKFYLPSLRVFTTQPYKAKESVLHIRTFMKGVGTHQTCYISFVQHALQAPNAV